MNEQKSKEEMEDLARHVKLLHSIALRAGVPAFDAWAIINDAFVHTCERKKPLPVEENARKAVLLKSFRFRLYRYFRERSRMQARARSAHEHATVINTTYVRDNSAVLEARQIVEMVIRPLTEEQLDVITEKALDELSVREVAERLGINENTAQSYWQRGCARVLQEMEKLEQPRRRNMRALLVFVGISGILTAARNARAMVDAFVRFFRYIVKLGSVPMRVLPGVATAASIVIVAPGQSGASADKPIRAENQAVQVPMENISAPALSRSATMDVVVPLAKPSPAPRIVHKPISRTQKTNSSVDALITMAKMALRQRDPQRALGLLDQIPLRDLQSGDAVMLDELRIAAKRVMAKSAEAP